MIPLVFFLALIFKVVDAYSFIVSSNCPMARKSIWIRRPLLALVHSDYFDVASEWIVENKLNNCEYGASDEMEGIHVVEFLEAFFPSSTAAKAVRRGLVTVDGSVISSTNYILKPGAVVKYHVRVSTDAYSRVLHHPKNNSLILYEDDHMAILNKPAGLDFDEINSLALRVLQSPSRAVKEVLRRPSVVHRLDRPVGGAIVVARTGAALRSLSKMFAEKRVNKEYTAVVIGRVDNRPGDHEINIPLQGKPSTTTYRVLANIPCAQSPVDGYVSLLKVQPKTGRTHQIRKHLAFIGHPVLLDEKYASTKSGGSYLNAWAAEKCPGLAEKVLPCLAHV